MDDLDRIRIILDDKSVTWIEKKMFGGLCIMVDDKMLMGTYQEGLMVRVNPDEMDDLLERKGAGLMMMTGRAMKGFLRIEAEGYKKKSELDFWISKCLDFNPLAKSSKKKPSKKKRT